MHIITKPLPPYYNMKKKLSLLLASMLVTAVSFADTLFETTFESEEDFAQWTVIDNNNDESTWNFSADASPSQVYYNYNSANSGDDWLISPAITPETDGLLMVEYQYAGSSYGEAMEVCYGSEGTIEAMTNKGAGYENIPGNMQTSYFLIEAKAGETLHLGFHATTPKDRFRLYLISVKVRTVNNPVDLRVSEIVSPVTGEALSQETVTVKVENMGTVDVDKFDVAFIVDGTTVATESVSETLAKGTTMEYTFTAKADLSTPRHKYTIKAYTIHPDDIVTANDTAQTAVRHVAPASVPYTMGFEPDEDTSGIQLFDLNEDTGNWGIETASFWLNLARTGYGCLGYNYDKNNNANDWAILEPINVEAGYHVLKFWYSGDDRHQEKLAVYWGNEAKPEAMTNKIVEYAPFARSAYEESISIVYFDKPQTICIGFYAFSDKDENWITVDDVSFDRITAEAVDLTIGEVSNPSAFHRSQNKQDMTFEIRNIGIKDTQAEVILKDGETVIGETSVEIKAQEYKTVTMKDALAGLTKGTHELNIEVTCDDDSNLDNNTLTHEVTVLGEPVKLWNFDDGEIPAEFTFRAEDEGTVNPAAGDEFNEEGWGLIDIETHWLLGEYVLGGTSWLEGTSQANRWAVMPKIHVNDSGECWFAWDANSISPYYLESYQVKVSETTDSQWEYTKEYEVTMESITPKTRGISLAKYAGKDVYVAFNLRTKNGDVLCLDNIGFYGDCSFNTVAIDSPTSGRGGFAVSGNTLTAGNAESIVLRDAGGRTVRMTDGGSMNLESLAPGMYIATVKTAGGQNSYKFVKR